jgi:hypothetical protein
MRRIWLLAFAAMALFMFGALMTQGAFALEPEEENNPRILCLVVKCSDLEGTLRGGANRLEDLEGKTIESTSSELEFKKCEDLAGEKDVNLCKDVKLNLFGTKKGAVACRSENAKGEKAPVENIMTLVNLHTAAELTSGSVLQPLLMAKILGTALEEELIVNCGGVKAKIKGTVACLFLPGLQNIPTTAEVEDKCEVNKVSHDATTGTCNVLCEDFGKIGLTAALNGIAEVDSWVAVTLKGKLNKDIFLDD